MVNTTNENITQDAVEWALSHGMAFKSNNNSAKHTAFSLMPSVISRHSFSKLKSSVSLLGKLVHNVAQDHEFLKKAISPITAGDPFFKALLKMHQQLHKTPETAPRLPLLIMRSDFMDDATLGPKLIEFNGIAAGMGPFGEKIHQLHKYIKQQWSLTHGHYPNYNLGELIDNPAISSLSAGIAKATLAIKTEFSDNGPATFLMIVQENEDNVFDQHLLEYALQAKGIKTIRKTFRDLYGNLSTGSNQRLMLKGIGSIDTVYLRAGYQYCDYASHDIFSKTCCKSLIQTRVLIEKHRVAVNATVSQQLATSKRVQMLLSSMSIKALTQYGLTFEEAEQVKALLGDMLPITSDSAELIKQSSEDKWVLKNQGEGGGHCVFGAGIYKKLKHLKPDEYQAWTLMSRLHPKTQASQSLLVRDSKLYSVNDLISEIGLFTVHINGQASNEEQGYAGYLIRSKSASTTEGGVHSGMGVLDSLAYSD